MFYPLIYCLHYTFITPYFAMGQIKLLYRDKLAKFIAKYTNLTVIYAQNRQNNTLYTNFYAFNFSCFIRFTHS